MERGQHLLFQGVSKRLLTAEDIRCFLVQCPKTLNMTVISGPSIARQEHGWAGMVLIAESHISVHTIGLEVYVDAFSCRRFPAKDVVNLAYDLLLLEDVAKSGIRQLERGWGGRDLRLNAPGCATGRFAGPC